VTLSADGKPSTNVAAVRGEQLEEYELEGADGWRCDGVSVVIVVIPELRGGRRWMPGQSPVSASAASPRVAHSKPLPSPATSHGPGL
jgi:hypothetical protein